MKILFLTIWNVMFDIIYILSEKPWNKFNLLFKPNNWKWRYCILSGLKINNLGKLFFIKTTPFCRLHKWKSHCDSRWFVCHAVLLHILHSWLRLRWLQSHEDALVNRGALAIIMVTQCNVDSMSVLCAAVYIPLCCYVNSISPTGDQ